MSSSRYASVSKHCNFTCLQGYCCAEEEERHQPILDSDAKCNGAMMLYENWCEKGCAVVRTQSLRITGFPIALRKCVTRLSLLQLASGDLWSACPPVPINASKARHVEALKHISATAQISFAILVLHILPFANIAASSSCTLREIVPVSLCLPQIMLGQQ